MASPLLGVVGHVKNKRPYSCPKKFPVRECHEGEKSELYFHARLFYLYNIPCLAYTSSIFPLFSLTLLIDQRICTTRSKSSYSPSSSQSALLCSVEETSTQQGGLADSGTAACSVTRPMHTLCEAYSRVIVFSVHVVSFSLPAKMSHFFLELPRTQRGVATLFSNPFFLLQPGKNILILSFPNCLKYFGHFVLYSFTIQTFQVRKTDSRFVICISLTVSIQMSSFLFC